MSNVAQQRRYNEIKSDVPKGAYHLSELASQIGQSANAMHQCS